MNRAMLQACCPWLMLLLASFLVAWLVVRISQARLNLRRLRRLHADQAGSVQSLSFVLTLPVFIMVILFIVQVSQLVIATIVVHYAAFAAARSASVWIPAHVSGTEETADRISFYYADPNVGNQVFPIVDPTDEAFGPREGGVTYIIEPAGPKYRKIASAAVMACMSISPSRKVDTPGSPAVDWGDLESIKAAYHSLSPTSTDSKIDERLTNKFAYATANTKVELRFFHKNKEPPLVPWWRLDDENEFYFNEVGWQDLITVTVKYRLALLPGPGRLLFRSTAKPDPISDTIHEQVNEVGFYAYPLEASATIGNEGEKSEVPYAYQLN